MKPNESREANFDIVESLHEYVLTYKKDPDSDNDEEIGALASQMSGLGSDNSQPLSLLSGPVTTILETLDDSDDDFNEIISGVPDESQSCPEDVYTFRLQAYAAGPAAPMPAPPIGAVAAIPAPHIAQPPPAGIPVPQGPQQPPGPQQAAGLPAPPPPPPGPPQPPFPPVAPPLPGQHVFGPNARIVLQPHPDNPTRWDRHQVVVQQIQNILNQPLTHRENREVYRGGPPTLPPHLSYPQNPYFQRYLNKLLLPETIPPHEYRDIFGVTVQEFYSLRDNHVMPALVAEGMRPYLGTPDAVTGLFLLKFHKAYDDRMLGLLYGGSDKTVPEKWFRLVLRHVYAQSPFLIRMRSLGQLNNLWELLVECNQATMTNSRLATIFARQVHQYEINNPLLIQQHGPMRLVVFEWDSRHLKIMKPENHQHQKRTYSSKIKSNAVVKLVGCTSDAIVRFIYILTASTSPSCTDESLARYMIDMETNLGEFILIVESFDTIEKEKKLENI